MSRNPLKQDRDSRDYTLSRFNRNGSKMPVKVQRWAERKKDPRVCYQREAHFACKDDGAAAFMPDAADVCEEDPWGKGGHHTG